MTKYYGNQPVLNGINYRFNGPGLYVILGPSGSGKTTLLNLLARIEVLTEGVMDFVGENNSLPHPSIVYQHHFLIGSLSALDNVTLPLKIQKKRDLTKTIDHLFKQFNLESIKFRRISQCSGGECQRINLMRAIASDFDYLLADEPTGSVDASTAHFIRQKLAEIAQTKLVIVVTHDLCLFKDIQGTFLKLKQGQLVEYVLEK